MARGKAPLRCAAAGALLLLLLLACTGQRASALAPPRAWPTAGESAAAAAGAAAAADDAAAAADAQDRARALGNYRLDPSFIPILEHRLAVASGSAAAADLAPALAPTLLPPGGSPKVLCILVDFPDAPWDAAPSNPGNTRELIADRMFGAGDPSMAPFESLTAFYKRASYGKLDIQGTVTPYYRAKHNRTYYESLALKNDHRPGNMALIEEALADLASKGFNLTQFDNDGDGVMETLYIKYTGLEGTWASFWWAYQNSLTDSKEIGGVRAKRFVWSWVSGTDTCYDMGMTQAEKDACSNTSLPLYRPRTDIHETGHAFGLPDLYDAAPDVGPRGGVGGFDLMDQNSVDLNGFFKWLLGWTAPAFVSAGTASKAFRPMSETGDVAVVFPGASPKTIFSEFFVVERRRSGAANDAAAFMRGNDGIAVWHIDATLKEDRSNFKYDNSYTDRKLVRLMEADGLNGIETLGRVAKYALYPAGLEFTPTSSPNSSRYDGSSASGVYVTHIGKRGGATIPATLSVGPPSIAIALPVQQRASYHATIWAASGSFVASGALVRGDAVLTTAAADACRSASCTVTLGPALPGSNSSAETITVASMVGHQQANLQLLFFQSCATAAKPVALPKPGTSFGSAAKNRPWMLTGWETLSSPGADRLAYSYVQYSADSCAASNATGGDFCAASWPDGKAGPCAGDVGSPLVFNTAGGVVGKDPANVTSKGGALNRDTLAGISRGSEVCGAPGAPAAFLSAARFSAWVDNNLASRRAPCWSKAKLSTVPVKPARGQPAKQVFALPPAMNVSGSSFIQVDAKTAASVCTSMCAEEERAHGGCKAFSVYSAVPQGVAGLAGAAAVPPARYYCLPFSSVPKLCGNDSSGYCANAVSAYRMVWTGK